ncbi:hypothetical protein A0H81_06452 [Grifola frondosa]|uniref:N-acetyltransferase domain-containing protein n=1 Tax=Grifola frondosa TaxID=5627 RepID=A0A1C7MAL8_GRIFR|nr:hypothetical protein A0H81_06452 [Grifola frondosa]
MRLWQDHLSHPSSIILYLSPEYTPDEPVAFLFAYPRRHATSLRGGQKESLHIWIAGVLPKRRKEGCLARLINELDSNAFLTTCTNPTQFPDMWRWLTRRGWVVDQELGGGKVMLSKRASE